jgi:endonuclease/exonuclease/phosphatase (EEP) superfamily protein YafD
MGKPCIAALKLSFLLIAVMGAQASCARATRTPRVPSADVPHLKIMSYNVNYGLAGDASIIEVIDSADCDVVFLQETTPEWEQALRKAFAKKFPHIDFRHCCGAGGLAILSKFYFDPQEVIDPPEGGWFPAWRIVLDTPLGKIQALNVHLRPQVSDSGSVVSGYFTTDTIRERQMDRFVQHLDPDLPTLIVGDFNENRSGDAVAHLLQKGYKSALPEFSPYQDTWRWKTSVGTITSQLDHIAYDRRLEPLNVWVLREGSSDHLPLVGVFELARTR